MDSNTRSLNDRRMIRWLKYLIAHLVIETTPVFISDLLVADADSFTFVTYLKLRLVHRGNTSTPYQWGLFAQIRTRSQLQRGQTEPLWLLNPCNKHNEEKQADFFLSDFKIRFHNGKHCTGSWQVTLMPDSCS